MRAGKVRIGKMRAAVIAASMGIFAGCLALISYEIPPEDVVYADNAIPEEDDTEFGEEAEDSDRFVPSEIPQPVFSAESGFYTEEFMLELSLPEGMEASAWILYTTDGSTPQADDGEAVNGQRYEEEIAVEKRKSSGQYGSMLPNIVRAVTVTEDGACSDVATYTYFCADSLDEDYGISIISLVTDSENLYDKETGLFMNTGQSGRDWERPAVFSYFSSDGTEQLNMNIGIRLHGGASRDFNLKSLRLYARDSYDTQKWFSYDFFSDSLLPAMEANGEREIVSRFKRLILRNGGNEGQTWDSTMLRDALIQSLMADTALDLQAYEPVVVYLNGQYYGLMNLRERYDRYYLAEHYNCDKDDVAVYGLWYNSAGEMQVYVADGSYEEQAYYQEFYDFVRDNDMSSDENYEIVCGYLDIENYIDYICLEIFCGNTDWPGNNCRAWRYTGEPKNAYGLDGKIRYMVYDTEFGFGLYGRSASEDYFWNAIMAGGTEWPNPDGATLVFRSLLENDSFRLQFASRYMDLLNANFSKETCNENLETMAAAVSPYFDELRQKYGMDSYDNSLNEVRNFITYRGAYAFAELQKYCSIGEKYKLSIAVENIEGLDHIEVNTLTVTADNNRIYGGLWSGTYASDVEVAVTAVAAAGYEFVCWNEDETLTEAALLVSGAEKNETVTLKPVFRALPQAAEDEETAPESTEAFETEEKAAGHWLYIAIAAAAAAAVLAAATVMYTRKK